MGGVGGGGDRAALLSGGKKREGREGKAGPGTEDQLWRDFPSLSSCQARHPSSCRHHARFPYHSVLIFTLSARRGRAPRQISRRVDCDKYAVVAATARGWEGEAGLPPVGNAHSIWPGAGM